MTLFTGDPVIDPFGNFPGTGINHIKISPSGDALLAAGSDGPGGIAALFSLDGSLITSFGNQLAPVFTANFSPSGIRIATAAYDGSVSQWTAGGQPIRKFEAEQAALCDAEYVGSTRLIIASDNGTTSLWSKSGNPKNDYSSAGTTRAVSVAPNGLLLASASDTGRVHLFNRKGDHLKSFNTGRARINSLRFSSNSKEILIGTYNGYAKAFNLDGKKQLAIKATADGITNQATYRPGSNQIATAGADGRVRLWNHQGDLLQTIAMPGSTTGIGAQSIAFNPDGTELYVAMTDLYLWTVS